jgi:hypothetical protein
MCKTPKAVSASSPNATDFVERLNTLLQGQTIRMVAVHKSNELVIVFESGATLFVDADTDLELSVT